MSRHGGWPSTGFGARLRALREAARLSQGELAEKAGCNRFTIAKMERGAQEPAWPLVLALAQVFGVDCAAFLDTSGSAPAPAPEPEPAPVKPAKPKRKRKKRNEG